jgi:DNA-directed RNA polymerase III subunit RPC3
LVDESYGQLSAHVFRTLALWGRVNLQTLVAHSLLSARHAKYALSVLIQQHLVLHSSAAGSDPQTFYEVDWNGAYNLMRSGKIINIVQMRFGEAAAQLVSNLLQLGHARVGDLEDAYKFSKNSTHAIDTEAEHINGEGMPTRRGLRKINTPEQLHSMLCKLLEAGFLTRVRPSTYLSPADSHNEADAVVKREQFPDGKVSGPKAKIVYEQALRDLKRKWRDATDDAVTGIKKVPKGSNGYGPSAKRMKTNGGTSNGVGSYGEEDDDDVTIDKEMVLKVSWEKCNVALRSQALQNLAARSIGDVTASVYGALLELLEKKCPRCFDDLAIYSDEADEESAQPTSTTLDITDILDPTIDLASTLAGDDDDDYDAMEDEDVMKRETPNDRFKGGASAFADRNKRLTLVEQHMALLAEHPRGFCQKVSTRGKGEWRVNFPALVRWMQRNEVEQVINASHGSIATRIVRMMQAKGKLDEKQVANFSLMRQKDIRSLLTEMHEQGYVEAQEVPKDNSRQPSRTIFLWYYDPDRCRQLLLQRTYKAQARLIQRMQYEKDVVSEVVQKAERLDVVGHEDEYLTSGDKTVLRTWREFEEKLLIQLARQDDLVALLRDFLPEIRDSATT